MTIAVNLNVIPDSPACTDKEFLASAFKYIVRLNTDHRFIFISSIDNEWGLTGENIVWIKAGPVGNGLLRWRYWQLIKLPFLLKKHKAEVLFSADCFFISTTIPQSVSGIHPSFLGHAGLFQKKYFNFYKKQVPVSLSKSKAIIVNSEETKNKIAGYYKIDAVNILVVPPAPLWEQPVSRDEDIKAEYTAGKEYFINTSKICIQANIISLLKAFSLFKKRQQTSMKLVLAGKHGANYDALKNDLVSYKYRDDVILTADLSAEERNKLISAAYALIDTSLVSSDALGLATAFAAGVPVISSFQGDSAPVIYTDAKDITDIAAQMMLLYKDEGERKQLVESGKTYAAAYSLQQSALLLWQAIKKTAAVN